MKFVKKHVNPIFVSALVCFLIAGYLMAEWRGVIAAFLFHIGVNFYTSAWVNTVMDSLAKELS